MAPPTPTVVLVRAADDVPSPAGLLAGDVPIVPTPTPGVGVVFLDEGDPKTLGVRGGGEGDP